MTRVLTLSTEYSDTATAVESITTLVTETFIRAPSEQAIDHGEWVRFRWLLADGLAFFEGVGKCETSKRHGRGYEVLLSSLSFDARNEAMYERILLSNDAPYERHTPVRIRKLDSIAPRYSSVPPEPMKPPPAKLNPVVKSALKPKPPAPAVRAGTVPPELVERARALSRRLNLVAPSMARGRWTEERVLEAALRMGIESLEGLLVQTDE